jgi:hypothetical protein
MNEGESKEEEPSTHVATLAVPVVRPCLADPSPKCFRICASHSSHNGSPRACYERAGSESSPMWSCVQQKPLVKVLGQSLLTEVVTGHV